MVTKRAIRHAHNGENKVAYYMLFLLKVDRVDIRITLI